MRRQDHWTIVAKHRQTAAGQQLAEHTQLQVASTCIGFTAIRCQHGNVTLSFHSHVQRIARLLQRPAGKVSAGIFGHAIDT